LAKLVERKWRSGRGYRGGLPGEEKQKTLGGRNGRINENLRRKFAADA